MTIPAEISAFEAAYRERFPDGELTFDGPDDARGEWWIDAIVGRVGVELIWRRQTGFGLFVGAPIYGERPNETYRTVAGIIRRLEIMNISAETRSPLALCSPAQLRALSGLTQQDVAKSLSIGQPSVSRLEGRDAIMLSSLSNYCRAIGTHLEIRVVGSDFSVPLLVDGSHLSEALEGDQAQPTRHHNLPIPKISLVVIRVLEVELVKSFYVALGLKFVWHRHENGPHHFSTVDSDEVFEIYQAQSENEVTANARVGLCVRSVRDALSSIVEFEPDIVAPLRNSEWGPRAVVADPAGTKVELFEKVIAA